MALIFTRPFFWILLGVLAVALVLIARRKHLRWLPALVIRFIIIALILAIIFIPVGNLVSGDQSSVQIMLVDQSDSLTENSRNAIQEHALTWKETGTNRIVFAFGDKPYAVSSKSQGWPAINGRATNLVSALEISKGLLSISPGKLIVATDGLLVNTEEVSDILEEITNKGHAIEFVPLDARFDTSDGYIEQLSLPSVVWQNTPTDVLVTVHNPENTNLSNLDIKINDVPADEIQVDQITDTLFRLKIPPQNPGITTLDIYANFPGDTFTENNHYYASVQVYALPAILFISNEPQAAQDFTKMLADAGLQVDIISPQEIPESARGLEAYKVIFIHNILATQMDQSQKEALKSFTTNLAGGLIFLGGNSSYTLGGYKNTLIEPMLPVLLEPPPRSQRSPVLFTLVLDVSGSMSQAKKGDIKPIDIEREAAMRVIESLKSSDYIGVLTYETYDHWKIRIRPLGDGLSLREALDAVSTIRAIGGTNMYGAMKEATNEVVNLPASAPTTRHMLVLSDGQSQDGSLPEFTELAKSAEQSGVTISTIALGKEADPEIMKIIANEGKGRFYEVHDPKNLPRIMLDESQAGIGENIQTGETSLSSGSTNHPVLYNIDGEQLPVLNAYNALSSKSDKGTEDILVSTTFEDPILSARQYGLGRVIAWMGDIGEEWTGTWQSPDQQRQFWSQVIQYALPSPAHGPAQVVVNATDIHLQVHAYLQDGDGNPVNLSEVTFTYTNDSDEKNAYTLPQVGAGEYYLRLNRPPEGAYRAVLTYEDNSGKISEVAAPFAVNVPNDWLSIDPKIGIDNINTWAVESGVISSSEVSSIKRQDNSISKLLSKKGIQWWLMLCLIITWPIEILIRRRWLPWT